jgi:hypothetical protein
MIERGLFSLRRMSLILALPGPPAMPAHAPLSGVYRTSNDAKFAPPIYEYVA